MKKITFFLLIAAAIAFGACEGSKRSTDNNVLFEDSWVLTELMGKPIDSTGRPPYLQFSAENQVTGSTGCNRLTGGFTLQGETKLKFSPLATTKMYCPDVDESGFLNALEKVNNYNIVSDMLILSNGKILLAKFRKMKRPY
ncbi:MAG TPA: META domain-containing protein [Parasegetibacter sp.]